MPSLYLSGHFPGGEVNDVIIRLKLGVPPPSLSLSLKSMPERRRRRRRLMAALAVINQSGNSINHFCLAFAHTPASIEEGRKKHYLNNGIISRRKER